MVSNSSSSANKQHTHSRKRHHSEEVEKKLLRLEKLAGIERIEVLQESKDDNHGTKVAIFHNSVHSMDVMRMIAECETLEGSDEAFIVVNLTTIYERFQNWCKKMPRVHPFYAIKCNNDPMVAKLLADLGTGFDCASLAEIEATVGAGITKPEMIIYANTIKQRSFIHEAERHGVRKMTFDNVEELEKIKNLHSNPQLVLRIRVDDPSALSHLGEKFGCDPPLEKGSELLKAAKEMGLDVIGISFHVGSGCGDSNVYEKAVATSAQLFDIGLKLGHKMHLLDLGGGFPGTDTARIKFDQIVAVVNSALEKHFPEGKYAGLKVIAEPGRYFGSTAVSLVAHVIGATKVPASRVTKKKEDADKEGYMYYLNDGVYGSFNPVIWDHVHPQGRALVITKRAGDSKKYPSIIWGPTCDSADEINPHDQIRKLSIGDWIYYPNMGAYTRVSASHFNGFQAPKPYYIMDERTWGATYGSWGNKNDGAAVGVVERESPGAAKRQKMAHPDEDGVAMEHHDEQHRRALKGRIDKGIEHQIVSLFE